MKALGVIPARLASTRLPRKALAPIAGVPMVVRAWRGAHQSRLLDDLVVATDSEEIQAVCREHGIASVMTSPNHASGTDRIREVATKMPADVYINIQGDEPMVEAVHVDALVGCFREDPATRVATLCVSLAAAEASNPNVVKVVTDRHGRALYFSRSVIPHDRGSSGKIPYRKHLGFYAYRREALELFGSLPPSPLEVAERLEQLRFLYHGVPILVREVDKDTFGVDTEEDRLRAERHFLRAERA